MLAVLLGACSSGSKPVVAPSTTTSPSTTASTSTASTSASTTSTTAPAPSPDPELLAAGDIADCGLTGDEATAAVIASRPRAVVAAVGDLAYPRGTASDYAACYGPSWGRFKDRTHPAPGNHEYGTGRATGYFAYWGAAAGPAGKGWYSYDIGSWHVVVLNSNCGIVGCGPDSEQGRWLAADLAAHRTQCALAYWHHPRFSSALHGDQAQVDPLWRAVAAGGVDVVLNGHDHDYERFGLIDGVREFVVGVGGAASYPFFRVDQGSEMRHSGSIGVLSLTLHPGSYDWRFLAADGSGFTDSGTSSCAGQGA